MDATRNPDAIIDTSNHRPGTRFVPEGLIANADLAMYAAKRSGRNSIAVHDVHLRADAADRLSLEADVNEALERGELFCAYPPWWT